MKTIFVNGTFDVLHQGHLLMLNYARSLGDILLVAVDSDRRVAEKRVILDQSMIWIIDLSLCST